MSQKIAIPRFLWQSKTVLERFPIESVKLVKDRLSREGREEYETAIEHGGDLKNLPQCLNNMGWGRIGAENKRHFLKFRKLFSQDVKLK